MKAVILAGGTGSRLHPLTRITNKHLLPIYDRPMVTYAIEAIVSAGISELMLVTGGTHAGEFFRLLGDGHAHGIDRLSYAYQERESGIADALGLAERFAGGDRVTRIVEKPEQPPSDFAVTGLYFYDSAVFEFLPTLSPSARGELEITDVNNWFVEQGTMEYDVAQGFWGDAGESIDAYYAVNDYVRANGANKP